jgi:hypothetical protein
MTNPKTDVPLTPEACLSELPELEPETFKTADDNGLRRAELRHSLRGIAELNHVAETSMVRGLVEKVLGALPKLRE